MISVIGRQVKLEGSPKKSDIRLKTKKKDLV